MNGVIYFVVRRVKESCVDVNTHTVSLLLNYTSDCNGVGGE